MFSLLGPVAHGVEPDVEINHLLESIGSSGCQFVRNGKSYPPKDAESHLRMKYRRGKRYASSAENFIERLASKSSMSGKPYWIECPGGPRHRSGDWLTARLLEFRDVGSR